MRGEQHETNYFCTFLSLISNLAIAAELSFLTVNNLDYNAWVRSILVRKSVLTPEFVKIGDEFSASKEEFLAGLESAIQKAPIVFMAMGPLFNEDLSCSIFSQHQNTVFVITPGSDGVFLDLKDAPSCKAKNILITAALDQDKQELLYSSNFGPYIRVAAPGIKIPVTNNDGTATTMSGTTAAGCQVAGELVRYARNYSHLSGADLVELFLRDRTIVLPKLAGKVDQSRALKDDK